jgi:hypothetical protein
MLLYQAAAAATAAAPNLKPFFFFNSWRGIYSEPYVCLLFGIQRLKM